MDRTAVEDFQEYHNHQPQTSARTPRFPQQCASLQTDDQSHAQGLTEDVDHDVSVNGSAHQSSDQDEAVFDNSPGHSSPSTSHHSEDEISILSDSKYEPPKLERQLSSSPYTPFNTHSPFRNPSSVRAMQMDTTPPSYLTSPTSLRRYNFTTPSRNGTPRSTRSHHSAMRSPSKMSPTKKAKREYPLVLLHVTLLPIPVTYSLAVMQSVLPGYILENWKLLQEKATDTVLERGILIPHPKEDYDLLEERLLESLELKFPRILKCGHFHLDPEEDADVAGSDADDTDSDDDADICNDCGRRIRDGRFGSGTGSRRWDIKLFAANGLMRSGAWAAAWREMERVDVEIVPWMDEDMRRELDRRREEEERHISEPEPAPEDEFHTRHKAPSTMDDARMREIYGEDVQPYIDRLHDENSLPTSTENQTYHPPTPRPQRREQQQPDIPLQILLRNYLYLAAQDRRNMAIFLLSILVLFLSLGSWSRAMPQDVGPSRHPVSTPDADYTPDIRSRHVPTLGAESASTSVLSSSSTPALTYTSALPSAMDEPKSEGKLDEVIQVVAQVAEDIYEFE
ncbi:hypothetical protein MMC07_001859 [Pseudocyphellaria aurata]|nr:hypothetical protein [Pseudocyphellaria aurata]